MMYSKLYDSSIVIYFLPNSTSFLLTCLIIDFFFKIIEFFSEAEEGIKDISLNIC